jgi:hypothetical protein
MQVLCEGNRHAKNMFGCPLKLILKIFWDFSISSNKLKYSYTIMYDCEKSPLTHEFSYIELFNFSHFFGTPTMNGPDVH